MAKMQKQDYQGIIKTAGILCAICFIATFALTVCNAFTADKIAALQAEATIAAQKKLTYEDATFQPIDEAVTQVLKDGQVVGYCVAASPTGFGGSIDMQVAIKSDGTLFGVEVISMSETPGLGAKCKTDDFQAQLTDKALPLEVIKTGTAADNQVVAITSATITTKAVAQGVNDSLALLTEMGLLAEGGAGN